MGRRAVQIVTPNKHRSAAQRSQVSGLAKLRGQSRRHPKDSENHPPPTLRPYNTIAHANTVYISSQDQILASQNRAKLYERQLRNERRKEIRTRKVNTQLRSELKTAKSKLLLAEGTISTLRCAENHKLSQVQGELLGTHMSLSRAQERIAELSKTRNRLSMQVSRIPGRMKRVAEQPHVQNVKEGGLIKESMRTMSRELVKLGVPVKNVSEAVQS